jgi:hypothetical protein
MQSMTNQPGELHSVEDNLRVPFWIVLAGVGVGAFWALAGVAVGVHVARKSRN